MADSDKGSAAAGRNVSSRRVFVVAGMHRAGTSVVARGLQALGIDLGERLMSASLRVNARGFFEDTDVVKLDDALLEKCDADWKNLALLDGVDWSGPAFADARNEARQLLEMRLGRSGQYGFKDPRVPRLLPFWRNAFAELGVDDAYVIAVRHPLAVIDSLTARDELDARRSGWLWLTHLFCALRYTAGRPRIVVDYDRLLATPADELSRIADGLGWPTPADSDEERRSYCETFLSDELRHARYATDVAIPGSLPPMLVEGHALAQRLARHGADASSPELNAEVDSLFERLVELSPLLAYTGSTERKADLVPQLRGELDWARKSLRIAKEFAESLQEAVRRKEAARLEAQRHAERLDNALHEKDDALATAKIYSDDLQATLRSKDQALATAKVYSDDLQATLRGKDQALAAAQAFSDQALATAQTYTDDLQAAIRRKDTELVAAHARLERIAERLVGRMLLRRIDRLQDGG